MACASVLPKARPKTGWRPPKPWRPRGWRPPKPKKIKGPTVTLEDGTVVAASSVPAERAAA